MGAVDFAIIVAVASAMAFCVRRLARGGSGSCGSCGSRSTCAARTTGEGACRVAQDMVAKADAALSDRGSLQNLQEGMQEDPHQDSK